jgi:hypothetical protein
MPEQFSTTLCPSERKLIIEQHDFFVSELISRVFSSFRDISSEADQEAHVHYEALASLPDGYGVDLGSAASQAFDRGFELYDSLWEMKRQVTFGALAILYQQWDKGIRTFIERELGFFICRDWLGSAIWEVNLEKIIKFLKNQGWNIKGYPWFAEIDAMRLLVNVFKHGKGQSFDQLCKQYPEYARGPFALFSDDKSGFFKDMYGLPDQLEISEKQFQEFADAIRGFWLSFPESINVHSNDLRFLDIRRKQKPPKQ